MPHLSPPDRQWLELRLALAGPAGGAMSSCPMPPAADPTLQRLSPQSRRLIERSRATRREAEIVIARARVLWHQLSEALPRPPRPYSVTLPR